MNLYEILGVSNTATPEEIKKAYRLKAKEHHPDVNQGSAESEESIKLINQAHDTLSDPQLRARYDAEILVDRRFSRWSIPVDLRLSFPIDLALAFLGGTTQISYLRTVLYHDAPVITMANSSITIPRRCMAGAVIRIPGGGNTAKSNSGITTGDLYVMVSFPLEAEGINVDRMGNVFGHIIVPLQKVLKGESVSYLPFPDVSSESFPLKLDPSRGQGHVYQIHNQGFTPNSSLFVKVLFDVPTNMSVEDRESLVKILDKYHVISS